MGTSRLRVFELLRRCAADAQSSGLPAEVEVAGTTLRVLPIRAIEGERVCAFIGAVPLDDLVQLYGALAGGCSPWTDIIGVLPGIVLTARPDGRIDYHNRYWRTYTGNLDLPSLEGLTTALAPEDAGGFSKGWKAGVESRHAFKLLARLRRTDGAFRWQRFSAEPLERQGSIAKWAVVVVDVHDEVEARYKAERATQRLRFLAEAGRALHGSFEPAEVARLACELVTEELGTRCVMTFHHATGVTTAQFPRTMQPDPSMLVLLSESPERVATQSHAGGAYVSIPITSRKVMHGTIVLDIPAASLEHEDEEVLADFGERVGAALENARLYSNERRIATTLQSQLLPDDLYEPYGMHVDATYFACEDETRVGGDWYDAFELPDSRIALTVGDVAGHGIAAAAMMGKLRHTIRAALLDGASPARALALANSVVRGGEPELTTAFVGILDALEMTLHYATAGHPPPVLASDGETVLLEASGAALGVLEELDVTEQTYRLPERGLVALYTDGVVEYAHDIISGIARLRDVLARASQSPMATTARQVALDVRQENPHIDDAAVLVLAFEPVRALDMKLPAHPRQSEVGRRTLARFARGWGMTHAQADDLVLASCEALNNAIEHAYHGRNGTVRLRAARVGEHLIVTVSDDGSWNERPSHEDRGLGLRIIRALADDVQIQRENGGGTSVRVTFGVTEPQEKQADLQPC